MDFRHFAKSLKVVYTKTVSSIAFYPAVIAMGFLLLTWLMLKLDFSETGKHIKANYEWIRLKDASTARTIVSTIAGGIISLMVFSFSMVMILLNQAASQMSNRMLESMIGNRFQQYVLGLYIGTIVYSLFLLSTIRDIESGIYVPALSIYLLLVVTVIDIFVFIYFLHYVTQSVKFETIILRVHKQTFKSIEKSLQPQNLTQGTAEFTSLTPQIVRTQSSGYFQGFDKKPLLKLVDEHDLLVQFLYPEGSYLLKDQAILEVYGKTKLSDTVLETLLFTLDFYDGQSIDHNYYYGFHQLAEVALKALSPGINDPETAVLSLNSLSDLFYYRLKHLPNSQLVNEQNKVRIILCRRSNKTLFTDCILPIWDYGKNDRYIQTTLQQRFKILQEANTDPELDLLLSKFLNEIEDRIKAS